MIISKIVYKLLRIMGKGATTLPGKIALNIKYDLLNYLSRNVKIICVTGTNGKTTTCALIEQGIISSNCSYFINKSGANMLSGVATAFVVNSTIFGKCKKEYAILECDENSFPLIARYLDAEIVLVTNIFRDQLDRYGEVEHTLGKIVEAISYMPNSKVVLNADCPMTYSISRLLDNEIITFGINDSANINAVSDINYCPICNSSLSYQRKVYSQLGDFYCSNCGYSRVSPKYIIERIIRFDEFGSSFIIDKKVTKINIGGIYNLYNYLSAFAVLSELGFDITNKLSAFNGSFGRMEKFSNNDKIILMLLVKNPVGFSNCINYVKSMKGEFDFVFALNDNEADSIDVSWIWDVDFKSLLPKTINITSIGTRAYDMAVRLKYDNLTSSVIDGELYDEMISQIKQSCNNTVIFSTYTSMMNMRHYLIKEFGGNEFWE